MSLLDAAIPPQVRLAIAGAVVVVMLVLAGGWYVCHLHNVTLAHDLTSEKARNDDLAAKVLQADQAVNEAKAINARMTQAMTALSAANAAAKAENDKIESAAGTALAKVAAQDAVARADDVKRRARTDLPSPEEMTDVLRGILEAM
jgi:hypothetical protein